MLFLLGDAGRCAQEGLAVREYSGHPCRTSKSIRFPVETFFVHGCLIAQNPSLRVISVSATTCRTEEIARIGGRSSQRSVAKIAIDYRFPLRVPSKHECGSVGCR
jgi:hypothetical protein